MHGMIGDGGWTMGGMAVFGLLCLAALILAVAALLKYPLPR
jgi:hypothetical protein